MKKVTLPFILFFTIFRLNSQINLEHSYTVNGSSGSILITQLSVSGYKYSLYESGINQVKLYNLNHSLWKTISWPIVSGSNSYFGGVSENLFDLDNQVEILVTYYTTQSPSVYNMKILNEDGSLLKDFPNRSVYTIQSAGANVYKLIVTDGNTIREVYSLPGTSSNLGVPNNPMSELSGISFPNPTSETISIPYQLANGQTSGQLNVYNSIGVLVESFQVDSNFSDLILDVSNYSNGLYRYNIVSNGIESESKSFVKQ
ncbi:MAG: hypothetical protein FGM14_03680 [Flavobacteriales bacterium]|nr:hypothetical protein [Flavobacteriales bacterium]